MSRCQDDPIYFIENYVYINSEEGAQKFALYEWQRDVVRDYATPGSKTILATSRQIGKSTVTVGFILWLIIFNPYKTAAIVANKGDTAQEMVHRIQFAYERIPRWMQQGIKAGGWNKTKIELENDSIVFSAATSKDSISGYTVDFLMIDEAAKIEHWEEFWTATAPVLSSRKAARIAMISTPLGLNHFYSFVEGAKLEHSPNRFTPDGKDCWNGFKPYIVPWWMVPGRDEAWKKATLGMMNNDEAKFAQEYEVEFMGSSGTLISGKALKKIGTQAAAAAILVQKDYFRQYASVSPDRNYIVVADVSEGKNLDYSAAQVIDITEMPYRQVFTVHGNDIQPFEYAEILNRVGRFFNSAPILVENNSVGSSVVNSLWDDFEYENLLCSVPIMKGAVRKGVTVQLGLGRGAEGGIKTTPRVKGLGCSMLKSLIEQDKLVINDPATVWELSTFSRKGETKTYQAEKGKHDDLVMPLVLFSWLTEQDYFRDSLKTLSYLKDQENLMDDLAPFVVIDSPDGNNNEDEMLLAAWLPETKKVRTIPDVWYPTPRPSQAP